MPQTRRNPRTCVRVIDTVDGPLLVSVERRQRRPGLYELCGGYAAQRRGLPLWWRLGLLNGLLLALSLRDPRSR